MTRHIGIAVGILLIAGGVAGADTWMTYPNSDLNNFTKPWGSTGSALNGKTDQDALGVDFDINLGTDDYGKICLALSATRDWSSYTDFWLKVTLLSAGPVGADPVPMGIELNPFGQQSGGWPADTEYKPKYLIGLADESTYHGALTDPEPDKRFIWEGDSAILHWDISAKTRTNITRFGFQVFTAGWWELDSADQTRPAQHAVIRITPIPEPATLGLLGVGLLGLLRRKRKA